MHVVTDLHLHSKFSRAVSEQMNLTTMSQYARQKGVDVLSATDFTHPTWFAEMQTLFTEIGEGVYIVKKDKNNDIEQKQTKFILSTEIACIYKHNDKLRRIHNLIFAPNLATVEKINAALKKRMVNVSSDGRPIMGLKSKEVLELLLAVDERCFLIPCHVWTPHFGLYGSASGYDSMTEAFEDLADYVPGVETGLSSDPDMNWGVPGLENRSIISTSDAHSPAKMGREATVFSLPTIGYTAFRDALFAPIRGERTRDENKPHIAYTIEFYPEEGKYHYSGHRLCKVSYSPEEITAKGNICPVCKRKLTEGVLARVGQLATKQTRCKTVEKNGVLWHTDSKKIHPPYVKLVPLLEIAAESLEVGVASQKAQQLYSTLCHGLVSEYNVLLHADIAEIVKVGGKKVAEGVAKVRRGEMSIKPGYDGEYGKVTIWDSKDEKNPQMSLL